VILILKIIFLEYYFLLFAPLRDLQFHRICPVTGALKYNYMSVAPVPRYPAGSADSELTSCRI